MGKAYSYLQAEQKTWIEHNLQYDGDVRSANLNILEKITDGENITLAYTTSSWGNIEYQHWFVTNGVYYIEFGSASQDIYNARVTINTSTRTYNFDGSQTRQMNQEIRDRVRHVLGMSNYSLCLRNCEHVANYIFRNRWISQQMDSNGALLTNFQNYLMKNQKVLVNTFPSNLRLHIFKDQQTAKLYDFITNNYVATRFDYYLDYKENTYNILVIGPTGAGKSHLINVFFNQKICDSEVSHKSVTREIYFVRGRGQVYDFKEKKYQMKDIVVADTIGLCDTEWNDELIISMIKGRINSNFRYIDAVYIVFRADRLLPIYIENIKKVLKWLNYNKNTLRFQFVGTYADFLTANEKEKLQKQAIEIFGLEETQRQVYNIASRSELFTFNSLIYTGFPPQETLNELTRTRVINSWRDLYFLLGYIPNSDRISLKNSSCTII